MPVLSVFFVFDIMKVHMLSVFFVLYILKAHALSAFFWSLLCDI